MSIPETATDRHTVTRLAKGDADALAELYDEHGGAVYSLALRIVRRPSEAEEVVQEVFAQAWRQAARYDPRRATVIGWLLMMTRARAVDMLRTRQARPDLHRPVAVPDLPAEGGGQEVALLADEAIEHVRVALQQLDESFRLPIELAYYEGLSHAQIAAHLDQPLGTIKTRLRTALARLRSAMFTGETR